MSAAARKARKREGVPFTRTPKVGTPLAERAIAWTAQMVNGKRISAPSKNAVARRERRAEITGETTRAEAKS